MAWVKSQDERDFYLSVLTLAEYDKGIANLAADHPHLPRIEADLRALEVRFAGRVLAVSNATVRRWACNPWLFGAG